jgi:peptide/nickel transport system ATP-binding protein
MPLVSVRDLRVYFKVRQGWVRAVDGVNLDLDRGETVGLVGESGCGKTTLAYAITQLLPSNAYHLGGQVIWEPDGGIFPYRREYWRLARERIGKDVDALQAKLEAMPKAEDGSKPAMERTDLVEELEVLRHPMAITYRKYLEPEIKSLEAKVTQLESKAEGGSRAAHQELAETLVRFQAAKQEGDLVDVTRRRDGRLREYHPKLSAVRWAQISIVFQGAMNALNPVYTVGDQIIEAIQTHEDMDDNECRKRVEELYRLVGIPVDRIDNYPHEYSGGMKQRAMIAMALALGPKLVIMDEPTTALDVITAAKIMDEILRIQEQLKMTLIIISHDVSTVAKVANRICVMYAGEIVEESSSKKVFYQTLHPYTQGLLGAFPSVKGEKRRIDAIPGSPPSLVNPPSGCRFHPRCKYAKDICTTTRPPTVTPEAGHNALCHFSQDFYAQGGLQRT